MPRAAREQGVREFKDGYFSEAGPVKEPAGRALVPFFEEDVASESESSVSEQSTRPFADPVFLQSPDPSEVPLPAFLEHITVPRRPLPKKNKKVKETPQRTKKKGGQSASQSTTKKSKKKRKEQSAPSIKTGASKDLDEASNELKRLLNIG